MIELKNNALVFSFPEVHPEAKLTINFQRTLRIPDDEGTYPLPPGLGSFPLQHVDDYANTVPASWIEHGGVMLPMYQSEAVWLNFHSNFVSESSEGYPFAVKVATGKINAITGKMWKNHLNPVKQDYLVVPTQPWLDGYCVDKGLIRQFVAMPLGSGYTAEEQRTGVAEYGGLQIIAYPMKREVFDQRFSKKRQYDLMEVCYNRCKCAPSPEMGLAPGGKMRQEIYDDPYGFSDWDQNVFSRCFVHIANSLVWRAITEEQPPTVPFTSAEYTRAGLPWFEYYDDKATAISGSGKLKKMKSIQPLGKKKGENPLPENESVEQEEIIQLGKNSQKNQVREGAF